jgi:hypothetical protein
MDTACSECKAETYYNMEPFVPSDRRIGAWLCRPCAKARNYKRALDWCHSTLAAVHAVDVRGLAGPQHSEQRAALTCKDVTISHVLRILEEGLL